MGGGKAVTVGVDVSEWGLKRGAGERGRLEPATTRIRIQKEELGIRWVAMYSS